jgi:hypothetical protein
MPHRNDANHAQCDALNLERFNAIILLAGTRSTLHRAR